MSTSFFNIVKVDTDLVQSAERLMIEKPKVYGERLQNQLAKAVINAAAVATQAASDGVRYSLSEHADTAAVMENAEKAFMDSCKAEEKMNFLVRRAKLAEHIRNVEDFDYLLTLTDEEKATLCSIVSAIRDKYTVMSKKLRVERIAFYQRQFQSFRKSVIDRLAKSATLTDASLKS